MSMRPYGNNERKDEMSLQAIEYNSRPDELFESRNREFYTVCVRDNMALEVSGVEEIYQARDTFTGMGCDPNIISALKECNISTPSLIQFNIWPYIFSDEPRNVIAQSQSGTGKTVCYIILALQSVDLEDEFLQTFVLTPTLELSYQVHEKMVKIGKYLKGLKVELATKSQLPKHNKSAQIVVGCCGTVLTWIRKGWLDSSKARIIIVDEADVIVQDGTQFQQLKEIKKGISNECLHMFFSATFSDKSFDTVKNMMYDPMCIRLRPDQLALKTINQYYHKVQQEDEKVAVVAKLVKLANNNKNIVFCNRREDANSIAKKLHVNGVYALILIGEMTPEDRRRTFDDFRKKDEYNVLICTDLCSRGIDIVSINLVINFHIPRLRNRDPDYASYYHRIGRGGRFGAKSMSITLVSGADDMKFIQDAEKYFKISIKEIQQFDNSVRSHFQSILSNRNTQQQETSNQLSYYG